MPLNIRSDKKGKLIEVFKGRFAQCNLLIMKKGSLWGKHYHKKTTEYFYLLHGEIAVIFNFLKGGQKRKEIFKTGDCFIIKPYTSHTVEVRRPTHCLVLYSRQFSKKDPDIY